MISIGVSPCFSAPKPTRRIFEKKWLTYIENDMAKFLAQQDVMPILLLDLEEEILEKHIMQMSGILFQAGSDIAPETYGEQPINDGEWRGDPFRDAKELKIFELAIKHNKPILGICRGCQLINVYFKGTLFQDLATEQPNSITHRNVELYDALSHQVEIEEGGVLSKIYPSIKSAKVNSVHHQAIKKLGNDLIVEARSTKDGVIEAISCTNSNLPPILGIGWHPEFPAPEGQDLLSSQPLLEHFYQLCRK